jgi:hypothetical protein
VQKLSKSCRLYGSATGSFGNVAKGSFRGPGYFDWDAAVLREFPIKGESYLTFRAEYFNLLNRTNFANPINAVSSAGFGSITSASDPRIAQLSLKFISKCTSKIDLGLHNSSGKTCQWSYVTKLSMRPIHSSHSCMIGQARWGVLVLMPYWFGQQT